MNITQYKDMKVLGNATTVLINGTPALRQKKYSPDTGEYTGDEEIGIDVAALRATVINLQAQIENINELISDAEALTK